MAIVTYKGNPIHLTADLPVETLQARREWQNIFKVLKGKSLQPRLLYLGRISFKTDEEIKSFSDKQKLREFRTTKLTLQQMSKGLILSRNTREEKRSIKSTPNSSENGNRNIYITNYFKCKWIKCSNQKNTEWLNGCKNKTHICAVYKKHTSDLKTHID